MHTLSGTTVDGYSIGEMVGSGGLATVYKATQLASGQTVAFKTVAREQIAPVMLGIVAERLNREAAASKALDHPHILPILDQGLCQELPYLVTEFARGSLKTLLKESGGRFTWREALQLIRPIVAAVDYAHQRQFIHRDIKPSNILISQENKLLLADFNLVKDLYTSTSRGLSQVSLTASAGGVGTPEYVAPEQWEGKEDHRADIYSLGATLYEMVTGSAPFVAPTITALMAAKLRGTYAAPRTLVPDLPVMVERLIQKAMAHQPGDRFQSAEGFRQALDDCLALPAVQPTRNWRPLMAGGLVFIGLVCIALPFVMASTSILLASLDDTVTPTEMKATVNSEVLQFRPSPFVDRSTTETPEPTISLTGTQAPTSAPSTATTAPSNTASPSPTYTLTQPSATVAPPTPTIPPPTAAPSNTPAPPPPTVSLDTPPGTVLATGQYWRHNDIYLVMEKSYVEPEDSCASFGFTLANNTNHDLVFTVAPEQYTAYDNTGRNWTLRMVSQVIMCGSPGPFSDSHFSESVRPGRGSSFWSASFDGPVTDPQVTTVYVVVEGLAGFSQARWAITIR